jgi:hypothetical protein
MEIDTSKLTDEQISKLGEYAHKMEEENKKSTKWWIMPMYPVFGSEVQQFGQSYYVEPQKDFYSRSTPPLKSDFESKEAAEKWLKDYLKEENLFSKAIDEINNLNCNLGHILEKFNRHEYVMRDDWHNCFESFNVSMGHGALKEVTKE